MAPPSARADSTVREGLLWSVIAGGSAVLSVWWVLGIRGGGGAPLAAYLPVLIPVALGARAVLPSSALTLGIVSFAMGVSIAAATGRGVVFLIPAMLAMGLELRLTRRRLGVMDAVAALLAFALPLAAVW